MFSLSSRRRALADRLITITTICATSLVVGRAIIFLFNHLADLFALSMTFCLLAIVATCLLRMR